MALADELLDNISEEQFAEYMLVEENPHIVIDKDRNIILPERYKVIAAQGDHNMATYTFDCPRFSDGRDMSKMVVYINYIRSDGETGSYPADNVSIDAQDNNLMHFEWTPLLPATLEHGAFAFLVCVCRTEPDGNMKNHWSTRLCKDATISEGMDCHQNTIIDMYPDVITRILERLNVLEDGGTTSVQYTVQDLEEEQKVQARKNIEAADAKEVSKLSEEKANRIVETASGEVIVVTDSDEAKPLGLAIDGKSEQNQYSGKNHFNIGKTVTSTENITTYTKDDNSITITTESELTDGYGRVLIDAPVDSSKTYTISFDVDSTCKILVGWMGCAKMLDSSGKNHYSATFNGITTQSLSIASRDVNTTVKFSNIQIEEGSVETAYEPYCGGIPSPNPSYPQEIRNIGVYDESSGKYAVEVEFDNSNLWLVNIKGYVDSNNKIMIIDNNSESFVIKAKKGVTYCFGSDIQTNRMVIGYSTDIPNVNNNKFFESEILTSKNFVSKHDSYVTIYVYANRDDNVKESFRVNMGDTLLPYEQPKRTTAKVLLDEPLRKGDKVSWNGGKMLVERNRAVIESYNGEDINTDYLSTTGSLDNGALVEYQLATPTTEEIDIDLGEFTMFYPTTILSNDCNANMEVTYIADTKAYVDKKITEVITAML